jgi:uncharacterized protein YaeQ
VDAWWQDNATALARHANLSVFTLTGEETDALQRLAARAMTLTFTLQDGRVWLASAAETVELAPQRVK